MLAGPEQIALAVKRLRAGGLVAFLPRRSTAWAAAADERACPTRVFEGQAVPPTTRSHRPRVGRCDSA